MGGGNYKVVEEWHEGHSWFRIWSSGLIEQGGEALSTGSITNVTLIKPFTQIEYNVLTTQTTNEAPGFNANFQVQKDEKTLSSFKVVTSDAYEDNSATWYAFGY